MNKFVITIEYHEGWDYPGPVHHYTVFGKSPEAVYVAFFSNLEKEMKLREKNAVALEKELKKISRLKQSDNYAMLAFDARHKYESNRYFTFQNLEFDVDDFLFYEKEKYNIDYNMVSVQSLDDWFTGKLIKG